MAKNLKNRQYCWKILLESDGRPEFLGQSLKLFKALLYKGWPMNILFVGFKNKPDLTGQMHPFLILGLTFSRYYNVIVGPLMTILVVRSSKIQDLQHWVRKICSTICLTINRAYSITVNLFYWAYGIVDLFTYLRAFSNIF